MQQLKCFFFLPLKQKMTHELGEKKGERIQCARADLISSSFSSPSFSLCLSHSTWGCTVSVELTATSHGHHDGHMPNSSAPERHCPSRVTGHCRSRCPEASLLPKQPRRDRRRLPQLPAGGLRGGGAVHRRGQGVQWVAPPLSAPPLLNVMFAF